MDILVTNKIPELDFGGEPVFLRRPHGVIIMGDKEVAHTMQCGHCGGHWVPVKGSGIKRGFCMNCRRDICGPTCAGECVPQEKMLELREAQNRLAF